MRLGKNHTPFPVTFFPCSPPFPLPLPHPLFPSFSLFSLPLSPPPPLLPLLSPPPLPPDGDFLMLMDTTSSHEMVDEEVINKIQELRKKVSEDVEKGGEKKKRWEVTVYPCVNGGITHASLQPGLIGNEWAKFTQKP